jgi:hypothetical protein
VLGNCDVPAATKPAYAVSWIYVDARRRHVGTVDNRAG